MALHAFYKLVGGTLEIDGVKMHQTSRRAPLEAAALMVDELGVVAGRRVLDVCTGLGYTALEEARRGAFVTTIEVDGSVLGCARKNFFSKGLFDNPRISLVEADAFEEVKSFDANSFDAVLHDPPRFSFAGELYSGVFYSRVFRILQPGGRLFHYTGKPGERSGKDFRKGVKERLTAAGFARIFWVEGAQGFACVKPALRSF